MGEFGIQILGDGEVDVAKDGIGVEGEQAVETLMETLGTLGYRQLRAAILAPGAAHPDIVEAPAPAAAPVAQLPVDADSDDAHFKCPGCGLTYAGPGTCVGGEFPHEPTALLPTEEVHALADPDGSKAAEVAKSAPPPAPTGNTLPAAEPIAWTTGEQDRRTGPADRRTTTLPVPAGAKDRRTGPADRRTASAATEQQEKTAAPTWPTT